MQGRTEDSAPQKSEPAQKKSRPGWPEDHAARYRAAGLTYPPDICIQHPLLTGRERSANTNLLNLMSGSCERIMFRFIAWFVLSAM